MNILDIYKKYQIMPQLAEHQFRVAGVADLLCRGITRTAAQPSHKATAGKARNSAEAIISSDHNNIITACLLHDMGNIVKFDLSVTDRLYPQLLVMPQAREYWQKTKQEFLRKYGSGSHNVTMKIVSELGVSARIRELVDCVGFDQAVDNAETADFGKKICAYADMRVKPSGVVALKDRMADLRVRYQNHPEGAKRREVFETALREIEKQIFKHIKINPEDITEDAVKNKVKVLRNFEISTTMD